MPHTLVLLRHGNSEWNQKNLFTGWVDVRLSDIGTEEANRAGELLVESGVLPDVQHTSVLTRAIQTANIALDVADRAWIDVRRSWRLNERHYGALQGLDKAETLEKYGPEQFQLWRRSFDVPPPPLAPDDERHPRFDPRYATLPPDLLPATECLADVVARMLPYWHDHICVDLLEGRTVLVSAHGNSIRALCKHLDGLTEDEVVALNIPTGIPLVYELDEHLQVVSSGYLDPEAAAAGIAEVANQGKAR